MTCSPETLMKQAGMTAEVYLIDAITSIERRGVELSMPEIMDRYPLIIAALINASVADYTAGMVANTSEEMNRNISDGIELLASSMPG